MRSLQVLLIPTSATPSVLEAFERVPAAHLAYGESARAYFPGTGDREFILTVDADRVRLQARNSLLNTVYPTIDAAVSGVNDRPVLVTSRCYPLFCQTMRTALRKRRSLGELLVAVDPQENSRPYLLEYRPHGEYAGIALRAPSVHATPNAAIADWLHETATRLGSVVTTTYVPERSPLPHRR
jgi:hypothetical protein